MYVFIIALTYGNSAGDPKYRVPVIDPLHIEQMTVQEGSSNFGLSLTATNITITGFKNMKVNDIR